MGIDRPRVVSRGRRLLAYLRHNSARMVVDVAVLAAWILVLTAAFGIVGLPRWLLYVTVFTGVVIYTRVTPTWERPYRSPD